MRKYTLAFLLAIFALSVNVQVFALDYSIRGVVIDKLTREPVSFATVSVFQGSKYAITDSLGRFAIDNLPPGAYRLRVDLLGYNQFITEEMMLSIKGSFLNIELEEESVLLAAATVKPKANPFRRIPETPLSQRTIGIQEIERNPGANRDISRVVASLPGVGNVAGGGFRNDILVRGGGPAENKYFLDGIEVPSINHFSTQGSSGGPVGIIDAEFIREVDFYGGSFPVTRGGAISSVLDFKLKDGDPLNNTYKFTVGASEAGFSSNGHLTKRTNYLVSARISYLQFLFKAINLPFLPTFTDMQVKLKTRFNNKHELTFLALGGIDDMTLNKDTGGKESNEYILAYLPVIQQEVFTTGLVYRYYYGANNLSLFLSQSYLNNRNTKYANNDESSEDNLSLKYRSVEQETKFRAENLVRFGDFRVISGVGIEVPLYSNNTYQKIFLQNPVTIDYNSNLSFLKYSAFANANYTSPDRRFTANLGVRFDGNSYSNEMANIFKQFSPRLSLSYEIFPDLYLNAGAGRYYQLPPFTALGFRDSQGELVNKDLKYIGSDQITTGLDYRNSNGVQLAAELFYRSNFNGMWSVRDEIPVEGKGVNYGVSGNEEITSTLKSRSYGVEFSARWFLADRLNLLGSLTLFKSQYRGVDDSWIARTWNNKRLLTLSAGYKLPLDFYVGVKYRYSGGTPYTPLDEDKSSLVVAWDASGRAYPDYSLYNSQYLGIFNQLDVRVDKEFFFKKFALKLYLDVQNVTNFDYKTGDVLVSTGRIVNPDAPRGEQRYEMKRIALTEGTILPSIGITVEF